MKYTTGQVKWDHEIFQFNCSADIQFQLAVKDDKIFRDKLRGETLFFVDISFTESEKSIKIGDREVILKTTFIRKEENLIDRAQVS